jgi:histidine decarboxylase
MEDINKKILEIEESLKTFIGYPCGVSYDYSEIAQICSLHINNIGSPESSSTYRANTKDIEIEVLKWFADLWNIKDFWGYTTSGGTEANLQGLYVAREKTNGIKHIFMTSADSHYSIFKIAKILNLNMCIINSQDNGEMDYIDFEKKLLQNPDTYVIVNANLGTTMKGAIDDTRNIYRIIKKHKRDVYIHVDGALSGFILPFIENDLYFKSHINSMSISCHKFLGVPFPCGIFLMEKHLLDNISNKIEYIGAIDCMISGSRNGHTCLFLKYIIDKKGLNGFKEDINRCIELAEYAVNRIENSYRNQNSITVVIPRPNEKICFKWQLASVGNISHLVVMPHVTLEKIDKFIEDLNNDF